MFFDNSQTTKNLPAIRKTKAYMQYSIKILKEIKRKQTVLLTLDPTVTMNHVIPLYLKYKCTVWNNKLKSVSVYKVHLHALHLKVIYNIKKIAYLYLKPHCSWQI